MTALIGLALLALAGCRTMEEPMAADLPQADQARTPSGFGGMLQFEGELPPLPGESQYAWTPPWIKGNWGYLQTYAVSFNDHQVVETIAGLVFEYDRSDITVLHSTNDWFVYQLPPDANPRVCPNFVRWWGRIDDSLAYIEPVLASGSEQPTSSQMATLTQIATLINRR